MAPPKSILAFVGIFSLLATATYEVRAGANPSHTAGYVHFGNRNSTLGRGECPDTPYDCTPRLLDTGHAVGSKAFRRKERRVGDERKVRRKEKRTQLPDREPIPVFSARSSP
jgi:hypothetical protein